MISSETHDSSRLSINIISKYLNPKRFSAVYQCMKCLKDYDDVRYVLSDYPDDVFEEIRNLNPNWRLHRNISISTDNPLINIRHNRKQLWKYIQDAGFSDYQMFLDDDFVVREIPPLDLLDSKKGFFELSEDDTPEETGEYTKSEDFFSDPRPTTWRFGTSNSPSYGMRLVIPKRIAEIVSPYYIAMDDQDDKILPWLALFEGFILNKLYNRRGITIRAVFGSKRSTWNNSDDDRRIRNAAVPYPFTEKYVTKKSLYWVMDLIRFVRKHRNDPDESIVLKDLIDITSKSVKEITLEQLLVDLRSSLKN